jgi:hypothetical protein
MDLKEEQAFRQWLSKNGYDPLPWSKQGIAFKKVGETPEVIHWVFPLARGGVNGTAGGYGAYALWRKSGVGPERHEVDVPSVSRDVAVELFIHHFQLAIGYLGVTPDDDGAQVLEEAHRQMSEYPRDLVLLKGLVNAYETMYAEIEI